MNSRSGLVKILLGIIIGFHSSTGIKAQPKNNGMDVSGRWRQVAPGMAGSNRGIYADKVDPNKVWVSPDMGNDYLSTDGGKHWESIVPFDGVWTRRKGLSDDCVVSDAKDNKIVLSLRGKDIDISTNGGNTFTPISSYASGSEPNSVWYAATAHPSEAGTWYVANGLENQYLRTGVNKNPLNSIDTSKPKVWKISDITSGARTIVAIPNDGMDNQTAVFDIIAHPDATKYPDMLFAATSTGLYRKENGKDWVQILDGCTKADYNWNGTTLTIYALKQIEYRVEGKEVISEGGVFKTTTPETASKASGWNDESDGLWMDFTKVTIKKHGFKNWVKIWFGYTKGEEEELNIPTRHLQEYTDIVCDPTDANKAYLSIWGGSIFRAMTSPVWATKDGGQTWFAAMRMGNGYEKDAYWATKQPGKNNQNTELGVADNKFPDFVMYDDRGVRSIAIGADGAVYVAAKKGYLTLKYDPKKDYWTDIDNTYHEGLFYGHGNADTGAFAVIPDIHHPNEMFLLQYEASLYKSTPHVHEDFPGIVGAKRVPALIDIGQTWAPGQPFYSPVTASNHPTDPDIFYTMSSRTGDIMKIFDNGTQMEILGEPIEVPNTINVPNMKCIYWSDLRVVGDGSVMYAIAEIIDTDNRPMGQVRIFNPEPQKGIYKSTNGGKTWKCLNSGLPKTAGGRNSSNQTVGTNSASVKTLIVDPSDDDILYAAVKRYRSPAGTSGWVNGGLYFSTNGSVSWSKATIPSGIKSLWDVQMHVVDGKAQQIYIAGGGEGSTADWGEGGVWVADYKANGSYTSTDWKKIFHHPFTSHIRTCPTDKNMMLVVTRETSSNGRKDAGTFYALSGGSTNDNSGWVKFNTGRGSMMVGDISFDSGNPNRVWAACESSGIYTALIKPTKIGDIDRLEVSPKTLQLEIGEEKKVEAYAYPLGITAIDVEWKSLDESAATVSVDGVVTKLKEQEAKVVAVYSQGGKIMSDTCLVASDVVEGIKENRGANIQLHPNPIEEGKLFVTNMQPGERYEIYDVLGNLIMKGTFEQVGIDVDSLQKGMYYLLNSHRQSAKFIKK
ncbi:Ig-like domain-containing protein [Reichenbachiella versicolor]|uniref:Ig-like domain-containing protein n=1 Tax=Reichenbachiella versicolor TaxID=1821036 RepID=UPI000D6E79A7|nr:Ig-like domain-containing protein [Reichenbachiella versicolor]